MVFIHVFMLIQVFSIYSDNSQVRENNHFYIGQLNVFSHSLCFNLALNEIGDEPSMVVHICNPQIWEQAGKLGISDQA